MEATDQGAGDQFLDVFRQFELDVLKDFWFESNGFFLDVRLISS